MKRKYLRMRAARIKRKQFVARNENELHPVSMIFRRSYRINIENLPSKQFFHKFFFVHIWASTMLLLCVTFQPFIIRFAFSSFVIVSSFRSIFRHFFVNLASFAYNAIAIRDLIFDVSAKFAAQCLLSKRREMMWCNSMRCKCISNFIRKKNNVRH